MATSTIDLPVDIWTEILSYLPLKSLLKTCTLNSLFLDLSVDFLYQDLYLNSTDPEIETTFRWIIRDQMVAKRVRRIYVTHGLGVPLDARHYLPWDHFPLGHKSFNLKLIHLDNLRRQIRMLKKGVRPVVRASSGNSSIFPSTQFVSAAKPTSNGISLSSVRELTISFPDRCVRYSSFQGFLEVLWDKYHLMNSLKRLQIISSTFDMPLLLLPAIRVLSRSHAGRAEGGETKLLSDSATQPSKHPPIQVHNIAHLSINLTLTSKIMMPGDTTLRKSLRHLLEILSPSLTSLSLSFSSESPSPKLWLVNVSDKHLKVDLSDLLENMPYLPALKKFKYEAPFTIQAMSNPGALTEWLRMHEGQLESLCVRPTALSLADDSDSSSDASDDAEEGQEGIPSWRHGTPGVMYSNWLTHQIDTSSPIRYAGFPSLVLTSLRTLEIQLAHFVDAAGAAPVVSGLQQTDHQRAMLVPPLRQISPSLTSLNVVFDRLDAMGLETVLDSLPSLQNGDDDERRQRSLERLRLCCLKFTSSILDMLHEKLPRLRTLEVACFLCEVILSMDSLPSSRCQKTHIQSQLPGFVTLEKKYPSWKFLHLRIAQFCPSRYLHPEVKVMKAIASRLEGDYILDTDLSCRCKITA